MRNINYKSDFDAVVRIRDCQGREIGWPDYDWSARFYTERGKANPYIASCKGGVCTHCFNDGGKIHVVFNSHRMGKGPVLVEFHAAVPNAIYPDGTQDLFRPQLTDIELVDGPGDCPTEAEIELMAPYIKGKDALEYAREAGYEGDAEQFARDLAAVGGKVDKVVGKGLSECDYTSEEKAAVEALPEKVQPLIEFDAEDFDYDKETGSLAVSAAAERRVFIDMWLEAGRYQPSGKWPGQVTFHYPDNPEAERFGIYDLKISYAEAVEILMLRPSRIPAQYHYPDTDLQLLRYNMRAVLPMRAGGGRSYYLFDRTSRLQRIGLLPGSTVTHPLGIVMTDLREIVGDFYITGYSGVIVEANGLQVMWAKGMNANIRLIHPSLRLECYRYIIENAANTKAITVTVHKDVYARIIDEGSGDWHALLEAASAKNISFATI